MAFTTINDVIYLDIQDFTTASGDNHDVSVSSSSFKVTCTSNGDGLTGLMPPMDADGAQVWVQNASPSNSLVIKDQNAGSTAGYRFILGGGSTVLTLAAGQSQHFSYKSGTGWVPHRPGTFS
jgi:hypothetical protein